MAANATDAVSNGNLKDLFDNVISNKVDSPATAGTAGQVLAWNGTATEWKTVSTGAAYEGVSPISVSGTQISVTAAGEGTPGVVQFATLADFRSFMGYTVG